MKAGSFRYERAYTLAEVFRLRRAVDGDAQFLAGGQSLLASLAFRLSEPSLIIDISRIPELKGISVLPDGYLRVGGGDGFHIGFEEREWADVGAPGVELAVRVDDVDEAYRSLREAGVQVGLPPEHQEWGARHAWLYDPDGYRLSIYSPSAS